MTNGYAGDSAQDLFDEVLDYIEESGRPTVIVDPHHHIIILAVSEDVGEWFASLCVRASGILVSSRCPMAVPPNSLSATTQYLLYVNGALRHAQYNIDHDSHQISLSSVLKGLSGPCSLNALERTLLEHRTVMGACLPALMTVAFGQTDPRQAFADTALPQTGFYITPPAHLPNLLLLHNN